MNPVFAWIGIGIPAIAMVGTVITTWVVLRIRVEMLEAVAELLVAVDAKYTSRESADLRFAHVHERLAHLETGR